MGIGGGTALVSQGLFGALKVVTPLYLKGVILTLQLTAVSIVAGLAIGLLIALCKLSRWAPMRWFGSAYTWIFRGTPLLVQIYLVFFGLPQFGIKLEEFPAGVLALSMNAGAYLAEIIRAAIESIPRGQMEAARSLGMSYGLAMRRVILPQAYRRMIPPMINEFVTLLKDSSLVSVTGLVELMHRSRQLAAATLQPFWFYGYAAFWYLVMTTLFTLLGGLLERRLREYE